MALQLDCPACFATLRLPDSTSGAIAACPQCQKRMRVPVVTIPDRQAVPAFADSSPALPPLKPRVESASAFFSDEEPDAEDEEPAEPINPHAVLARRNKRRMSRGWIGVILAFVLATAGISFGYWWSNRSNVIRNATATVIANATLSRDLTAVDVNVNPADWAAIEKSLEQNPADLRDAAMRVQMEKSARGLQLSLTPTTERMLVAVPTSSIAELQVQSTKDALGEAWKTALTGSLTSMSATVQQAVAAGTLPKLRDYGEPVGMEGLAGATGYHFRAAVGNKAYPCVFEDANHQLYFLVPPGTKSLAVIPRDVGARHVLPAKMRITAVVK